MGAEENINEKSLALILNYNKIILSKIFFSLQYKLSPNHILKSKFELKTLTLADCNVKHSLVLKVEVETCSLKDNRSHIH